MRGIVTSVFRVAVSGHKVCGRVAKRGKAEDLGLVMSREEWVVAGFRKFFFEMGRTVI